MRWSVGIEAEGDRVLTREEVVELADAVAASHGIATGIGTNRYGAQLIVEADSREEAIEKATEEFRAAAAKAGLPAAPVVRTEAISEAEDDGAADDPARLAGRLPVRGPAAARRLDTAAAPRRCTRSCTSRSRTPSRSKYAVIYVGHADDLSAERFPFQHPRAACWIRRAGSKWKVYICTYEVPGGGRAAPGADRPRADRDLPAELQRAAVRPRLEGRVDRRDHLVRPAAWPKDPQPRPGYPRPASQASGTRPR